MWFNDDEQIDGNATAGDLGDEFKGGNAKLKILDSKVNPPTAPLDECSFKVMLQLTGQANVIHRPGLDLVTVLDVSASMKGQKMKKLKEAMEFVVQKLSPIDRLSVVTFSKLANRLCPLRLMNESSKVDIIKLIKNIAADGGTNITDGLEKGLRVLNERELKDGRSIGIMLMSDGEQNRGGDAALVQVSNVPVYTFGFGTGGQDRKAMADVLNAIAKNSDGGTFSDVQKIRDLSLAFASCLGGLLTVAVQDLRLTFAPERNSSTVNTVSAGDYPQSRDKENEVTSPITVTFGTIYDNETRRVIVELLLPEVTEEISLKVLGISYKYSNKDGRELRSPPLSARVKRVSNFIGEEEDEVIIEGTRVDTAKMMKEARVMADDNNMNDAKIILDDAQNMLANVDVDAPLIEMLKREVAQLLEYLQCPDLYKNHGRSFALSSELSHDRQRFAARGDIEKLRLFATPRMDLYQQQAKTFIKDPTAPVPTVDEDQEQEIAADPLGPFKGPLSFLLQQIFEAVKAIEGLVASGGR